MQLLSGVGEKRNWFPRITFTFNERSTKNNFPVATCRNDPDAYQRIIGPHFRGKAN